MQLRLDGSGAVWGAVLSVWCLVGVACAPESSGGGVVIVPHIDAEVLPEVDAMVTPDEVDAAPSVDAAVPTSVARRVLHECFSGSNCGPCAPSAERLQAIFDANPGEFTAIKYQIGSDPYISREAVNRRMMYLPGEMTYGIPYVHADGVNGFHPNEINDDAGYQQHNFDMFQSVPTPLDMTVSHTIEGQTITVDVGMTVFDDVPGDQLRLFIAVIENVTYRNLGSNG